MSNINPNNIDGTYPVAGQDNDSQGFRDNFTNIRNNLTFAKSEIEDLASKVILKQALTGGVLNNDLVGSPLVGALVSGFAELRKDFTTVSGSQTLNFSEGHYQKLTTGGTVTLTATNWPASGRNGRMRLEVNVASTTHQLVFTNTLDGGTGIRGLNGNTLSFDATGVYLFELESDDGGTTLSIRDLLRARSISSDFLSANATTSSATLGDIGLSFQATAGKRYSYNAVIPISHSSTDAATFSVSYSGGSGVATVEQQTSDISAYEVDTITASDSAVTASTGSIGTRMVKIFGVYHNSTVNDLTVNLRFATVGGTLTALAGSTLTVTQVN